MIEIHGNFGGNPMGLQWEKVACYVGSLMCFVLGCKDDVVNQMLKSCLCSQKIVCTQKPKIL